MSRGLIFELVGVAGISIGAVAYLPQVVHLAREHCSAGISSRAWVMWLASAVLVGALALYRLDPVFIALQATSLSSAAVIVVLARRYRGMYCETHTYMRPENRFGTPPVEDPDRDVLAVTRH
jgi:lipid-A-disaccharide synthase-like uncharacterized protein